MSNKAEGFVVRIFTKSGQSRKGKWVADSFKIEDPKGNEDPFFYRMGFRDKDSLDVPPSIKEGDYIRFEYTDNDDSSRNYVDGSGVRVKNAPERQTKASNKGGSARGGQTQQNIHYQNSRTAAIETVAVLLENDGLSITGAKTKAGQAKRYEEIVAAVNKLTVQFFNDLETFRLLDVVADAGVVDTEADDDLPDGEVNDLPDGMEDGDEPL